MSGIWKTEINRQAKVSPTLAAGITVTGGAAWVLGAFSGDIAAANAITKKFQINCVSIEAVSADDVYELVIYYGAGDTEAGRVRFAKDGDDEAVSNIHISTPIIPANSRIRAKVASAGGGNDTVDVSIHYITF